MRRVSVLLMAVVMVLGTLAGPAAAMNQPASFADEDPVILAAKDTTQNATNETNDSDVAPGERLAGIFGVMQAEFEGEVEERAFRIKMAQAETPEAKARIAAEQLERIEERLATLQNRTDNLNESRTNGSITEGEYRAKMASVVAELETVKRLINSTNRTTASLPVGVLSEKNISVESVQSLKNTAENLSGPAVTDSARRIAGPTVGAGIAGTKAPVNISQPNRPGPPEDTPTAVDNATDESGPPVDTPADEENETDGRGPPEGTPGNDGNETDEAGSGETPSDNGNETSEPGPPEGTPSDEGNETDEPGPPEDTPSNDRNDTDESGQPGDTDSMKDRTCRRLQPNLLPSQRP